MSDSKTRVVLINCTRPTAAEITTALSEQSLCQKLEMLTRVVRVYRANDSIRQQEQIMVLAHTTKDYLDDVVELLGKFDMSYPASVNILWPVGESLSLLQRCRLSSGYSEG